VSNALFGSAVADTVELPTATGTHRINIPAIELADGTVVHIRATVIRGRSDGPVFYVGGGVHGDEVGGIAILADVARRLTPEQVNGTVVLVPVQNPLGFQSQHRLPVGLVLKSPTDQSPNDMYTSYPGDPSGNSTQIMSHLLYSNFVKRANFVIDMHTPTVGGRYVPFAFLPPPSVGEAARAAKEIAGSTGVDAVLSTNTGVYVQETSVHVVAARRGIPAFGIEMGEGGRVEPDLVGRGSGGILNALRHVGILDGPRLEMPAPRVLKEFVVIRARRGGLWQPKVGLGDWVEAGAAIGSIIDSTGEPMEEISSPVAGLFVRATTFPSVCTGERVGQIGVPE
jgi:predicted deacylase